MSKLKLINILKNKILEQGPIGIDATADDEDYGENYGFDDKGKLKKIKKEKYDINSLWPLYCNMVLDEFEGGYWFNPEDLPDENKCKKHPPPVGSSTETMFGIDRVRGEWDKKPSGKIFWGKIDKEKEKNGATKVGTTAPYTWSNLDGFCKIWKWLYRGGALEEELKGDACNMILTRMKEYMGWLKESLEEVESNQRLLFHFAYACWNGPGHFQDWAIGMNEAVKNGKTGNELVKLAIDQRNNWTSGMDENLREANRKVTDIIKNDPRLGDPYVEPS